MSKKKNTEKLTDQEIQDIIRLTFPDDFLIKLNHQLFALNDLLEIADKNKVEEITEVVLTEVTEIRGEIVEEEKQEGQPGPAGPSPGGPPGGPEFMDEEAMMHAMQYGGKEMPMKKETPQQKAALLGECLGHGIPIRLLPLTRRSLHRLVAQRVQGRPELLPASRTGCLAVDRLFRPAREKRGAESRSMVDHIRRSNSLTR